MRKLGERLRGFRLENGWSKRSVARRLGVSTPSIIRWEDGIAEPNDYNRYKIERLLSRTDAGLPQGSAIDRLSHVSAAPSTNARNGTR
jgi:transcriptional regulator with XRE-family HTH domain